MTFEEFLSRTVTIDLEAGRDGRLYEVGAVLGSGGEFHRVKAPAGQMLRELDDFARDASIVVGHNIVAHDRRLIEQYAHGSRLLDLPIVDTLYLAPLSHPKRPYHALVKDYKRARTELSHPVADCRLTNEILRTSWESLARAEQVSSGKEPTRGLLSIYRSCFVEPVGQDETGRRLSGTGRLLEVLGGRRLPDDRIVRGVAHFATHRTRACLHQIRARVPPVLATPSSRPAIAYALAWLRVSGEQSVLPRWVQREFPEAVELIQGIRSTPCGHSDCAYCRAEHDPRVKLKQYFRFDDFRARPAAPDGTSLQALIVKRQLERKSLLAILPTGGGKSLCYQLPALMQYDRTGALTIVISPLQALMKDQVQNVYQRTGRERAAVALNGMLTMVQRAQALKHLRLGDYAMLYVSPEQLRTRSFETTIRHRQIATWVFDEAHCISKWGHDFRPDYWYAARFIADFSDREGIPIAPVACFTATAKQDVRTEIRGHFARVLQHDLLELAATQVDRENLNYAVEPIAEPSKPRRTHELLTDALGPAAGDRPRGSAIVYASRRKRTEEFAEQLRALGWNAHHFHAGLEPPEKKRVQDAFLGGEIPVIVATNAFGMGIDKDDVRLVVHVDVPGSIENYLQEAGRAGRDRERADCVLLYADGDLDTQFDLASRGRLEQRDLQQILAAIRKARRRGSPQVVVSPGELLRVPGTDVSFDQRERSSATKVKTAVA